MQQLERQNVILRLQALDKRFQMRNFRRTQDVLKRESGGDEEKRGRKRRREPGLFDPPEEARTPVGPKHIQEAYRRLQKPDLKANYMSHIPKGNWQRPLKLI